MPDAKCRCGHAACGCSASFLVPDSARFVMLKILGGTVGIIFLIGLLVVIGILMLIF
jgi:hypothetical protein